MPLAATWMGGLKMILPGEVSHTENEKYHLISLKCGIFENNTN